MIVLAHDDVGLDTLQGEGNGKSILYYFWKEEVLSQNK
jgi:hypothetical protein